MVSTNDVSQTTTTTTTTTTTIALMISKGSDASFCNMVLWVCHRNTNQKNVLTYYHYQDHSHQFNHTDALMQRLQPNIQVIHVGVDSNSSSSSSSTKSNNNNNKEMDAAVKRLLSLLEDRSRYNHNTAATTNDAATETSIDFHSDAGTSATVDWTRLKQIVQQLLGADQDNDNNADNNNNNADAKAAWLQFIGDTYLQQHVFVTKALQFYLTCAINAWPVVRDDAWLGSFAQINVRGHLDSHLVLDTTAAEAIHLWPPANAGHALVTGGSAHNNSIAGMLTTHAVTAAGKRLLLQWLRQPLVDLNELTKRQDAVETLVKNSVGRDAVRDTGLRQFAGTAHDLSKLAANLKKYSVALEEEDVDGAGETDEPDVNQGKNKLATTGSTRKALMALYNLYVVSHHKLPMFTEKLTTALDGSSTHDTTYHEALLQDALVSLQKCQAELLRSVELCEAVLDLEAAPQDFLVRSDYKDELVDIVNEMKQLDVELEDCHADMNQQWAEATGSANTNQVRLERVTNENYGSSLGWQFRLPNTNDSKTLDQQFGSSVKVHRVLKNGVYFTTSALRKLSTQKSDLMAEYDRNQREIVMQAMAVAATYVSVLQRADVALATVDAIAALAHTAAYSRHGYCRPTLTDSNEDGAGIELVEARHPCVELQENMEFIPNNVKLIFGESSFLLVTGPNMGGKSTYIRSLGAIVTLAQIGSFVPCKTATINICHHILARVGAGDLQERGISTFMAEMLESSSILRTATKRSLIIIDELGRGTSTFDGYGLARAISEYIVQEIGCMTIFATHFHELTALEDEEKAVQNCHVTAQKGSQGLTFLYQVKPGPCLESFGIQVAEMANVPAVVIRDAKRRARELENFEYRSKRAKQNEEVTSDDTMDHASAEQTSAAMAFGNRLKRLSADVFQKEYASDAEKRQAFLQMLKAA